MKLVTIIGARPQFIKAAVLSRKLLNEPDFEETVIHTGQHYDKDMSDNFFQELQIPPPAYNLGINNLPAPLMTGSMLEAIQPLLVSEAPDMVVVYGDTNSTLAGALAAKKLLVPIAHIEAGLRSGDMKMPEELNRLITDRISDLLFCPTETAVENLKKESFEQAAIHLTGDIMLDASLMFAGESKRPAEMTEGPFALCTFHRHQLIASPEKVKTLLNHLIALNKEIPVMLVAHPRTKQVVSAMQIDLPFSIFPPLSYLEMLHVIKEASLVITDSGGLQKEAYFFKKPCITIRHNTEWKELVNAGVNVLAGDDGAGMSEAYQKLGMVKPDFSQPFYGDGNAAGKIIDIIRQFIIQRKAE
jgi:UDP-GlcNAc3NAcA epimerase